MRILTEVYTNCTKTMSIYFRKIVKYSGLQIYFRKYIIKTVKTIKQTEVNNMKFTEHGYKMHDEKHQKFYRMTMGDLKIDLMQNLTRTERTGLKIRLVDVKAGEVEEYQNMTEFLMKDFCNGWEIELLDAHTVHMNTTNEDIIVVCFRDDETEWE